MHWNKETIMSFLMYIGGAILVISFLTQNYAIFKNKSAVDIAYLFIILQLVVNVLYVSYAAVFLLYPIMITNSIITILLVIMFFQKIYYVYTTPRNENIYLLS